MEKQRKKRWNTCKDCHQLVYTAGFGVGNHKCPEKVLAMKEAELDMVIDTELSTWDMDLKKFWRSNDVKFAQYLLDEGRWNS